MSTYILQKDFFALKSGTPFCKAANTKKWYPKERLSYKGDLLDECPLYGFRDLDMLNTEWFKPENEDTKIRVKGFYKRNNGLLPIVYGDQIIVATNKNIEELTEQRYEQLCTAIELVLNDGTLEEQLEQAAKILSTKGYAILNPNQILAYNGAIKAINDLKWTDTDMYNFFKLVRETGKANMSSTYTYTHFEDCLTALNNGK